MAGLGYRESSISAFYANTNKQLFFNGADFVQGGKGNVLGISEQTDFRFGRFRLKATTDIKTGHKPIWSH